MTNNIFKCKDKKLQRMMTMEIWVKLIWFLIAASLAVYFIFDERIISLIILLIGNILVFTIIECIFKNKKRH